MTTGTYIVPDNPADPESSALELIVRLPVEVLRPEFPHMLTEVLQDYCGVLHAEGAFAGLTWADAKAIAAAVSFDAVTRDDAADFLRNRARNVLAGADNMEWENRDRSARALNIAATVLGL
ncbi:MAG: hypothetical protein QOC62_6182 [Mycobacterium sp.]|jgi:hypothetical protein|nr:hypothetical protein [Mycobacterium sp.]